MFAFLTLLKHSIGVVGVLHIFFFSFDGNKGSEHIQAATKESGL